MAHGCHVRAHILVIFPFLLPYLFVNFGIAPTRCRRLLGLFLKQCQSMHRVHPEIVVV